MTSRVDALKTNEFLRRRKLRLQQVREQSKDIAKKIRQRAKVETLRQLDSVDAKKEKEYLDCQEKLVKHLELLYSKGLQNVGASHKDALEVTDQDCIKKTDISKLRGKEAAELLRKKKQEKLDEQKKLLDRKLQARETANELSREKSAALTKNLNKSKKCEDIPSKISSDNINQIQDNKKDNINVEKNDMGTQWESEEIPNEWVPNVPILSLPKDDSGKESLIPNTEKSDKRINLFALSDEMPSSLRGGFTSHTEGPVAKPALTLVSEYLQNRNLRLRHTEPSSTKKTDDLQSIKQTILRTRAARPDGNVSDKVCHVLDKQVIPVPSWRAEDFGLGSHQYGCNCCICFKKPMTKIPVNNFLNSQILLQRNLESSPALKDRILHRRNKNIYGTCQHIANKNKLSVSTEANTGLSRKKSITVYNHNTRNIQDLPCGDDRIVSRDTRSEEDAYAQALKETTIANTLEKEQLSKHLKDMRTKVAVNKNNVDKEYKDTLAFLNSIAKDKSEKPIKTAYLDEHRQEQQNERHQRKLQEEFKKIERECNKHNCKHGKRKSTLSESKRNKSRSPIQREMRQDFEYSWMPVPESDGNLAVHTIPNNNAKSKSGNTVKFSQTDSYHEYRSRHKHTPPTKDISNDKQNRRVVETVILQESIDSDVNESSVASDSSVENLNLAKDKHDDSRLKDAERIIIYKILEAKKDKKSKEHKKDKRFASSVAEEIKTKVTGSTGKEGEKKQKTRDTENSGGDIQRAVSFERLQEGVYEAVNSNGDNIASMYFAEGNKTEGQKFNNPGQPSCCDKNKDIRDGSKTVTRLIEESTSCNCSCNKKKENLNQHSAATSSTSFTTALNNKTSNRLPDSGFVKLIEEGAQDSNTFYVGASGFLKDDNYEVVIQLRKKDTEKSNDITTRQSVSVTKNVDSSEIQEIVQNIIDNVSSNKNLNEDYLSPVKEATKSDANNKTHESVSEQIVEKENKDLEMPQESNLDTQFNKMCEKAVLTSFHDDFAYPATVAKTDSVSRPGTSTYTQTSFNSSVPRPVFMHMSSSTSTAYMSPPELILPKFLKQNYAVTKEELYESENTMNQLDSNFEVLESYHCNEFNNCRCKIYKKNALHTPPNTARSHSKENSTCDGTVEKKRKCLCHKCQSRSDTNICHKNHSKTRAALKTKSSKDLPSENGYSTPKQSSKKNTGNKHSSKNANHKMNPVVKEYVNKLLDLNSEGLKAIKIINQDCSAVTTPGSSIINLPCNKRNGKSTTESKISLEQIKNILKQQILKESFTAKTIIEINTNSDTEKISQMSIPRNTQNSYKLLKRKSLHKVKSLNISKHILKKKKPSDTNISRRRSRKTSLSIREDNKLPHEKRRVVNRSKSSSTPRKCTYSEYKNSTSSDIVETSNSKQCNSSGMNSQQIKNKPVKTAKFVKSQQKKRINLPSHRATRSSFSSDSGTYGAVLRHLRPPEPPVHISTQTNGLIDTEIHFMKVAEDKLQNMEKIADLTEKCTKRLSNLAKVLEEVRRNKSLVYGQISTSDSAPESDQKADKNELSTETSGHKSENNILTQNKENVHNVRYAAMPEKLDDKCVHLKDSTDFTPVLKDIPKPDISTAPSRSDQLEMSDKTTKMHQESENTKARGKPPPALSRIHLKGKQDVMNITPHELSTVIEVDSPMSMRLKSQPSRQDSLTRMEVLEKDDVLNENNKCITTVDGMTDKYLVDPDLLKSNISKAKKLSKVSSTDSSDDSKMRMMNMKTFNDIMLKPFISLKEYAKQCNIGLDDGSNLEDLVKDDPINDELSSLHSDGSLPDVIAELLKRNIISEPFKFDSGSNVNSNVSSESTLSVLALSQARKEKKKSAILLKNKENMIETSETLSISSNPDLENAFQKLGMGWASSTLKKTKERLALSSSSNTSSSSLTKFKIKSFSQDLPNLATDSTSSFMEVSNRRERKMSSPGKYNVSEMSRNAVQQTSLSNSMTVKEFLTNELAKKITFNNKSTRKGEEEFISLYETKMPEQLKHTNIELEEEQSVNQNRARTSTPVQIFKSNTYHSSSTSNTSNGFFSNADDLSSVKVTSSIRNHSTSDKDDLTIPNYSLKTKKVQSDCSKSD